MGRCPRCGKETELLLASPRDEGTIPRRIVVYSIIGILILLLGLAGALLALKRAQNLAERNKAGVRQAGQ
jgi:hypothetical protein